MTVITDHMRHAFREQGFVVVPDVLTGDQIASARAVVKTLLEKKPYPEGHVGPYFLWPRFGRADHPLLDLYRAAGIGQLAAELLRRGSPWTTPISLRWPPPSRPGRTDPAARTWMA